MTSPAPDDGQAHGAREAAERHTQLEQLDRRMRALERLRLSAATKARRVALDVALCRMEATRLMLCTHLHPLTGATGAVSDDGAHPLAALPPGT